MAATSKQSDSTQAAASEFLVDQMSHKIQETPHNPTRYFQLRTTRVKTTIKIMNTSIQKRRAWRPPQRQP
ncbi:hypothetical protein [Nitrosomonas cryotolerans]|uniref:hypothetical protein n=1 Tax=Nitrosomonas cryotolerans TaxID=44575 RepID=UPI0011601B49|nr:hypothetical protein [Nitrosomonas cryotolerans]